MRLASDIRSLSEVVASCCINRGTEHGVVILEDDAYFYQQHNAHDSLADDDGSAVGDLQNLGATFVAIDHKGPRVLTLGKSWRVSA